MKPFFNQEDFKQIGGFENWELAAHLANAKLERESIPVYTHCRNVWSCQPASNIDTHAALLLNIQPIEPEKPKCQTPAYNGHHFMSLQGYEFCGHCGKRVGS